MVYIVYRQQGRHYARSSEGCTMRAILILWAIPIIFFWGWYGLSANNINFGYVFLSRAFHDQIFTIYGNVLQMPAEEVPAKLAWLFFIDSLILLAVAAFRWRKSWWPSFRARCAEIAKSARQYFSDMPQPMAMAMLAPSTITGASMPTNANVVVEKDSPIETSSHSSNDQARPAE